ncbi:MAG: translation initiation factor IF-3 [Kiritimatiellae bacterium]|nr:translation initiation factor IF-3 [Kiritimatiellia bacterium]MBP5225999.1 translation initiation factor IF-3 [Kiritimatiellia bacterium]
MTVPERERQNKLRPSLRPNKWRCAIASFTRVNYKIRVPNVRVIDADGSMKGVMATRDAQRLADQQGLDLVEISPNAEPPVCKIMDYGKFRYEESIKRKQAKKNQKVTQIKEIKFHASVDVNDLDHKVRQIHEFLAAGHKIKVTLQYRGRENAHKELGSEVIERVISACADVAVVEQAPKLIGRVLGCLLAPKPASAKAAAPKPATPPAPPPAPPAK